MLLVGAILLIVMGLAMVYSSSVIIAIHEHQDGLYYLKRQMVWLFLGVAALLIGRSCDYQLWERIANLLFAAAIILLILTLLFGKEVNGSRRWLMLGPLSFQTSEFMKIALVVYLAKLLSQRKERIKDLKDGFLPPIIITGITACLIIMQPHLGMALIMCIVAGVMVFMAGARVKYFLYLLAVIIPLLYILIFIVGYGRERVLSFINPWADPLEKGYHIIQSMIAIGSGGLLGKGPGDSYQKLFYLPYPYTDFIFAIIGEELGFLGAGLVVILFLWLCIFGIKISINSGDYFGRLLGIGLVVTIVVQAIINMGVTTGILPITGLPLPFISYGGSGLFFSLWSLGIILNIAKKSAKAYKGRKLVCGY